jgi:hypothetical protein
MIKLGLSIDEDLAELEAAGELSRGRSKLSNILATFLSNILATFLANLSGGPWGFLAPWLPAVQSDVRRAAGSIAGGLFRPCPLLAHVPPGQPKVLINAAGVLLTHIPPLYFLGVIFNKIHLK